MAETAHFTGTVEPPRLLCCSVAMVKCLMASLDARLDAKLLEDSQWPIILVSIIYALPLEMDSKITSKIALLAPAL